MGSGGGRTEVHGDFWMEIEGGRPEVDPKCMELLPCELVIARYNDCAHQDSGRLGRCAAVLGYVSCELLPTSAQVQ